VEQAFDVETCSAEAFDAFADAVSDIEDVERHIWPLEVRRDLINELWQFCEAEGYEFPLTEVPAEAAQEEGA
jgi:hypothetical protein